MSLTLQTWVFIGSTLFLVLLIYAIGVVIKQKMIAHRLTMLAEDILIYGRFTLTKHLQRCEFCRNTSHVAVWEYGDEHTPKEVLICYLCASRTDKLLEPPTLPKNGASSHDRHPLNRSRSRHTVAR